MLGKVQEYIKEVEQYTATTKEEIENFRLKFLSKKGIMNQLFASFKDVPADEKKEFGKQLNLLKQAAQNKLDAFKASADGSNDSEGPKLDLTRPGYSLPLGSRHPVSIVRREIIEIFSRIGFVISEGPEIEDDWHNFTALNFPPEHPARDMQDTFFVKSPNDEEWALRTHTSSVQVRVMENQKPPIRTISPGRVFRNEAISARSHCIFHQIEGLYIDEKVSFADLKETLLFFAREFFGKTKIRLRPSYFPFTEPSAEMDVYWGLETEIDKKITKGTGWLEVLGCGMVDPQVLENCGIDSKKYSGFAFGMGIERIAMQRFGITDIRMLFENDIRMLEQFKAI